MLTEDIVLGFFIIGIQLMVPILLAALGEAITEKSGVLNVGIEGVMIVGAFATAFAGINSGNAIVGILAGVGSGILTGAILAFFYVYRGTDQIVTGLMFNLLATGFTGVLHSTFLAGKNGPTLPLVRIPGIDRIPWLGPITSQQNAMLYVGIALAFVVHFFLYRTWWGLYTRSAGERPTAAESGGLNIKRLRAPAVIIGCAVAATGGSALVLSTSGGFVPGMTAGRGFIALGVVVLARWRPAWVLLCALGFGLSQGLQFLATKVDALAVLPGQFWIALPYAVTLVVVVFAPGSRYPAAVGIPYQPAGKGG
ncbi:MAG: ABC transporter permease [Actinomycetota bacterium]